MIETILGWGGFGLAVVLGVTGIVLLAVFVPRWLKRRKTASAPNEQPSATTPPPAGAMRSVTPSPPEAAQGATPPPTGATPTATPGAPATSAPVSASAPSAQGATSPPAGAVYNAPGQTWQAPTGYTQPRPIKKLKKTGTARGALVGGIVGAVLLAGAIPLGAVTAGPLFSSTPAMGGLPSAIVSETDAYRFTAPTTLGEYESAKYNFRFDPRPSILEAYDTGTPATQFVGAYLDSELKTVANFYSETEWLGNSMSLRPDEIVIRDSAGQQLPGQKVREGVGVAGSWSVNEIYLMQYVDRDGNRYDKPIVTRATIEPDADTLPAPQVDYAVTADGALQLSWQPVDGAASYMPVWVSISDSGNNAFFTLGEVGADATSWLSTDGQTRDCYLLGAFVSQNCSLSAAYSRAEDRGPGAYGVIAMAADGTRSFVKRVDGSQINPLIPVGIASPYYLAAEYNGSMDSVPAFNSVRTLSNGDASLPVTVVGSRTEGTTGYLQIRVQGTDVVRELQYNGIDGTWDSFVEQARQKLDADSVNKTGAIQASLQRAAADADPNAPVSSTQPAVSIPLTDDFGPAGEFIAANLLAGSRKIDLGAAPSSPYSMYDLMTAVITQTPAALVRSYDIDRQSEVGDGWIVSISYEYPDDQLAAKREEVWAKAQQVVAEVIRDDMSDHDKALALNDWIAANAEYDDGAYQGLRSGGDVQSDPRYAGAWNAAGVLVDGRGVCASYAAGYKLLSDVAGLESVYVSGAAYAIGHAWNKTFMDGKWQVVDPTWNDSESAPNALFGITDEVAKTEFGHTFGAGGWTIPTMAAQYAAN